MRVSYQSRFVYRELSTEFGTPEEVMNFVRDIMLALADMGAPLQTENIDIDVDEYSGGCCVPLVGEDFAQYPMASIFGFYGTDLRDLAIYCTGRSSNYSNRFEIPLENMLPYGGMIGTEIHAVKCGDSFFFGLMGPSDAAEGKIGCISYAITPMRRLSNPSANLGYAIIYGARWNPDLFLSMAHKTLPYIPNVQYSLEIFNSIAMPDAYSFPEVDTGKVALIPFFSGLEDIYYDKVYFSPVDRDAMAEKCFETDRGTFLIGKVHSDGAASRLFNLAFDITEAVSNIE